MNPNGIWQEDQEGVEGIILDYFSTIFKSDHPINFEVSLNAVTTWVTPDMNDELLADFKVEEVWRTLKQMHPTKSLGLNGLGF